MHHNSRRAPTKIRDTLSFDRLVLLAASGFRVYSGRVEQVEKYFRSFLNLRFPERANPADVILDVITLESAVLVMAEGGMTQAPQEATLSKKAFGSWLADLWRANIATQVSQAAVPWPALQVHSTNWGEVVFIHMKIATLQFRRDGLKILANNLLLVFSLLAYCFCAPSKSPADELLNPGMALFLLTLTQGVASQRVLGGNTRYVVWREAGAAGNTAICFVGRDLAAMLEVLLAAVIFTAIYWTWGPLLSSHHTVFWTSWALVYAVFGLNYVWSVLLSPDTAQMMAVVTAFLSFMLAGLQPPFASMMRLENGKEIGPRIMALSPMRWAYGRLLHDHTVLRPSVYRNSMVRSLAKGKLDDLGMPLEWIHANNWTCGKASCQARWSGDGGEVPSISFVCNITQLLLLGIYYRAVALLCMSVMAHLKSQGGGSLFGTSGDGPVDEAEGSDESLKVRRSCGSSWQLRVALKDLVLVFLVLLTDFQMSFLLLTS